MNIFFSTVAISGALVLGGAIAQAPAGKDKGLFAVVKTVEGSPDEVLVETPDNPNPPPIAVGTSYAQGSVIICAEAQVMLSIEGSVDGTEVKNSVMMVKHDTQAKIDKALVEEQSVVTRVKMKSGEVRIKVTDERVDYSTDMKVATPNATASVKGTDVNRIGFNANKGTYVAVAAGSIAAARADGTVRNVGGGTGLTDSSDSILDAALANAAKSATPIGMSSFEVAAGQLTVGGADRPASDLNNAATNPNAGRVTDNIKALVEDRGFHGFPPIQVGHGNRR